MDKKDEIKFWFLKKTYVIVGAIITGFILALASRGGERFNHNQNETVKFDGLEYSIIRVEKKAYDLYEDYIDLKVTFKIKNTSKETKSYSSWNFGVTNKKGEEITKAGVITNDGTYLKSGDLDPGKEVEGAISWIVKKDATDIRVRYTKDFLTNSNKYDFQWSLDK